MTHPQITLRPSAAPLWVRCAGMPRLAAGIPELVDDDEDPVVREEGTACHWGAHLLGTGQPVTPGTVAPNGTVYDADMLQAGREWLQHLSAIAQGVQILLEQPLHCYGVHHACAGTTDATWFNPQLMRLGVADLKYGYLPVEPDSWQLLCYVDGACNYFGVRLQDVTVDMMIFQPRGFHRDGARRVWSVPGAQLLERMSILTKAASMAYSAHPLCTVNTGCKRCPAAHVCPTLESAALDALDMAHAATPHDLPFHAAETQLRVLQWAGNMISARVEALETQVKHSMKRGTISKHFDLEPTMGRLNWTPEGEQSIRFISELLGKDIRQPEKLITPTQAKEVLPPGLVDAYARRSSGALRLVPADAAKWARLFGNK